MQLSFHTLLAEKSATNKEREGSIKGEGGLYKELKIPALPPKLPRSGVTFHFLASDMITA